MKFFLVTFLFLFLFACSEGENPATAPAPADEPMASESAAPAASTTPSATINVDAEACEFFSTDEIAALFGDRVTSVSYQEPLAGQKYCQKIYNLILADGQPMRLLFKISPSSPKGIEREIAQFEKNAVDIPGLMKHEMAADGQTHIGTHVSQRRLYILRSGMNGLVTLGYDQRGSQAAATPEKSEEQRQMGIMLINEYIKRKLL